MMLCPPEEAEKVVFSGGKRLQHLSPEVHLHGKCASVSCDAWYGLVLTCVEGVVGYKYVSNNIAFSALFSEPLSFDVFSSWSLHPSHRGRANQASFLDKAGFAVNFDSPIFTVESGFNVLVSTPVSGGRRLAKEGARPSFRRGGREGLEERSSIIAKRRNLIPVVA
jgi:hypothetical protein